MTPQDISQITQAIETATRPFVTALVDRALQEIPAAVRQEFRQLVQSELAGVVREEIRKQIQVSVVLRTEQP